MIIQKINSAKTRGDKLFSLLIDPGKLKEVDLLETINRAIACNIDLFFVGGSLITLSKLDETIKLIKKMCSIPVVIFPGSAFQVSSSADALLFLTLISGRNPEFLIGQQVVAVPLIKSANIETISTGYILIDGGKPTSVSYMSGTTPIPHDKDDIALCTALAGEMMGNQLIYLDTGSGAEKTVSEKMIKKISSQIKVPLIVGGGINSVEKLKVIFNSGADIVVVGNAIENNIDLLKDFITLTRQINNENYSHIS
jgi:phosphoglycerol geranylgeranyltransferase